MDERPAEHRTALSTGIHVSIAALMQCCTRHEGHSALRSVPADRR